LQSALTAAVRDILGRQLTEQEIYGGFDLGRLEGYKVQVVVKHKTSSAGNVYAVADTIIHQASPGNTVTPVSAHPEPFWERFSRCTGVRFRVASVHHTPNEYQFGEGKIPWESNTPSVPIEVAKLRSN
jgi:hypothetical protein